MNAAAPNGHWRLASDIPGRLRLRMARGAEHLTLKQIADALEGKPGIVRVETNTRTRSILINYGRERDELLTMLHDAGIVLAEASSTGAEAPGGEGSSGVENALADLETRLHALTGMDVKMRTLFPLGLAALGAWRTAVCGLGLSQVPAFILFWYAFDLYYKFNVDPKRLFPHEVPE